jgi:lipopolysaccharide/colanic/teichoic acid biosynthesis glycosyltransferase
MNSEYPHNPRRQDAFWSPDLTFEYGGAYTVRIPGRGTSRRAPVALWRRAWNVVRSSFAFVLEHTLLAAAVVAPALPMVDTGAICDACKRAFKRSVDILGASCGLVLALPLFLVIPILIKLDSPGPIFYRQTRIGLDRRRGSRRVLGTSLTTERRARDRRCTDQYGRPFQVLKFRSMVNNAERTCGPVWASMNDPRITRLGAFLRRSRIDEIPQLLNVLVGQMSLVGPRPERPHFVSQFCGKIEGYPERHRVKPGITGLAQVENGYDRTEKDVRKKTEYDLHYIENWNPALDLNILLRTVKVVVSGRGAQ